MGGTLAHEENVEHVRSPSPRSLKALVPSSYSTLASFRTWLGYLAAELRLSGRASSQGGDVQSKSM
jgi:hypothetical protein